MAKYDDLIIELSEEIEIIKDLQTKENEISGRLNTAYEAAYETGGHSIAAETIEDEISQVYAALCVAQEDLTHKVELAYWDVPFAKAREQGRAKFFELAEI